MKIITILIFIFCSYSLQCQNNNDNFHLTEGEYNFSNYLYLATNKLEIDSSELELEENNGIYLLITEPNFQKYYDTLIISIDTIVKSTVPYSYVYREKYNKPIFSKKKMKYPRNCLSMGGKHILIEKTNIEESFKEIYIDFKGKSEIQIVLEKSKLTNHSKIIVTKSPTEYIQNCKPISIMYLDGTWTKLREVLCSKMFKDGFMIILFQQGLNKLGYLTEETGMLDKQTRDNLEKFKKDYQLSSPFSGKAIKLLEVNLERRFEQK